LSGVVIMALVYQLLGPIALIWPAIFHGLFDLLIPSIQAYVFCMLTMSFIKLQFPEEAGH